MTISAIVTATENDGKPTKRLGSLEFLALPSVGHEIHVMGAMGHWTDVYIVTAVQHMAVEPPKHPLGPDARVYINCIYSHEYSEDDDFEDGGDAAD